MDEAPVGDSPPKPSGPFYQPREAVPVGDTPEGSGIAGRCSGVECRASLADAEADEEVWVVEQAAKAAATTRMNASFFMVETNKRPKRIGLGRTFERISSQASVDGVLPREEVLRAKRNEFPPSHRAESPEKHQSHENFSCTGRDFVDDSRSSPPKDGLSYSLNQL